MKDKYSSYRAQIVIDEGTRQRWQMAANNECSGNLSAWIRACCEAGFRLGIARGLEQAHKEQERRGLGEALQKLGLLETEEDAPEDYVDTRGEKL